MKLVVRPDAKEDLKENRDWYEARRSGLGDQFRNAIRAAMKRIQQNPNLYAVFLDEDIRRARVEKFPFSIFYIYYGTTVEVLRIRHDAKRPFQ